MTKTFKLTKSGVEELKKELEDLKSRRGDLAEAISTAKEQGDLSENSEYADAKDEQGRVEGRIQEIEHMLNNHELINEDKKHSKVSLGATVTLKDAKDKEVSYTVVGSVEANPAERKISDESPIGQALMGKKPGYSVTIVLPAGEREYEVISIK